MKDFFDNRYFQTTKKMLWYLGLWPYQTLQQKLFYRTFTATIFLSVFITQMIKFVEVRDDYDKFINAIPSLASRTTALAKWIIYTINMKKLERLSLHMETDWKSRPNGGGSEILKKYAKHGGLINILYVCYIYFIASSYAISILGPVFLDVILPLNQSRPRDTVLNAEYYVDGNDYFIVLFLHNSLVTWITATVLVAVDSIHSIQLHYACGIFAELSDEYKNFVVNKDDSLDVRKNDDDCYYHLIACIKKHKKVLEFCETLASAYSTYFLVVITFHVIEISVCGAHVVMNLADPKLIAGSFAITFGEVIHSLFGCWNGQLLINESMKLHTAVYSSNWYTFSYRSRRLLLQILMNTAKPLQLPVGKFSYLSLQMFSAIMRTAMSYFTVLSSMQ